MHQNMKMFPFFIAIDNHDSRQNTIVNQAQHF